MKKFVSGFGAATMLAASAASADTQDATVFQKGRLVLDVMGADIPLSQANGTYQGYVGPVTLQSSHTSSGFDATRQTTTTSAYGLEPSLDYFITDHLTVGGRIGLAWQDDHFYDASSSFGATHYHSHGLTGSIAPRLGYAIPIGHALAFWPRVSAGLFLQSLSGSGEASETSYGEFAEGNFSLVARLAPHVLLELGPVVTYLAESSGSGNAGFFRSSNASWLAPMDSQLDLVARSSFRVDF